MYQYNNPLLAQYQAQLNALKTKYNEELKNIQESVRREEANMRGQLSGTPVQQAAPTGQQPIPEQPSPEMQPIVIPNDVKILAVLGDIKGILDRAFPKAETTAGDIVPGEPAKVDEVKPEPKLKKNEGIKE